MPEEERRGDTMKVVRIPFNSLFEMLSTPSCRRFRRRLTFNSLFEMRHDVLRVERDAEALRAFNSLFEMQTPRSPPRRTTTCRPFNSLFEMRGLPADRVIAVRNFQFSI